MRSFLFFILFIVVTNANAQDIVAYYDYQWEKTELQYARYYSVVKKQDSLWQRQDYFIHENKLQMSGFYKDQRTAIPHGKFYYFYPSGQLQSVGVFQNGKKQGVWLSYHLNGMMRDSVTFFAGEMYGLSMSWHPNGYPADSTIRRGNGSGVTVAWFDNGNPSHAGLYADGKQTGKWKYFHKNGQLSAEEIYDGGQLTSAKYFDENGTALIDNKPNDREVQFAGGEKKWERYKNSQLHFPDHLKITNSDKAVVVVTWVINEDGEVEDPWVSVPFHPEFDKIVLNAIRKSPRWIPQISKNRRVKAYMRQAVTFAQEE